MLGKRFTVLKPKKTRAVFKCPEGNGADVCTRAGLLVVAPVVTMDDVESFFAARAESVQLFRAPRTPIGDIKRGPFFGKALGKICSRVALLRRERGGKKKKNDQQEVLFHQVSFEDGLCKY